MTTNCTVERFVVIWDLIDFHFKENLINLSSHFTKWRFILLPNFKKTTFDYKNNFFLKGEDEGHYIPTCFCY